MLDKTAPHRAARWAALGVLLFLYALRVYFLNGFFIVTYGLGIYLLNLFIGLITPPVRGPPANCSGYGAAKWALADPAGTWPSRRTHH